VSWIIIMVRYGNIYDTPDFYVLFFIIAMVSQLIILNSLVYQPRLEIIYSLRPMISGALPFK
jgi:hypothetical protein